MPSIRRMARSLVGSVLMSTALNSPAVVQPNGHLPAAGHDVIVGQDHARGIDDHARAEPPTTIWCGVCRRPRGKGNMSPNGDLKGS